MGWLVFSNVYVALCGAALTAATYALLGLPARLDAAAGLVFAATLVVYNLDRLVEPKPGQSQHEQWVTQHRRALWVMTALAAVGCIIAATCLGTTTRGSLLLPTAVALSYCLPVLPTRGPTVANQTNATRAWRLRRLKELPGAKLLLIGAVWTYATAGLPMLEAGVEVIAPQSVVLLIGRLLFILAVALPFDVPDIARDRASGIVTLPQRLGVAGARRVSLGLTLGFVACSAFHPWPIGAAMIACGAICFALLSAMHERRGVFYYEIALDGLLLVQSALILAMASAP